MFQISVRAAIAAAILTVLACALPVLAGADEATAAHTLAEAISQGTPDLSLRWRYEYVDDDALRGGAPLVPANASTVRTALGFTTADYRRWRARLQFEAIGAVGTDEYFDGSGSGNREFAAVVDPEGAEINEGWVEYRPRDAFTLRAGRQSLAYRKAPFHRFVGTIPWRQNWQSFDAVSANYADSNWQASYTFAWRVNRIFGRNAPRPLSVFESASHLVNVRYRFHESLSAEAYAYLLDFDNARRFSSNTYGLRLAGKRPVGEHVTLVYAGEWAYQHDASDNPFSLSESYYRLDAGVGYQFDSVVRKLTVKLSYEVLGGDGSPNGAFTTILGTNHAFQGWADRFLITPDTGIEDFFVTAVAALPYQARLVLSYHDLDSDAGGFDYGNEFDAMAVVRLADHYQIGLKAAFYNASTNAGNRAGALAADVTKYWLWAQVDWR